MPEEVVETPTVSPETPAETPKPETQPKVDPSKPLSQQVDKMLEAVPEKKAESKEEPKPEEPKKAEKVDEPEPEEPEQKEVTELPPVAKYILENLPDIQVLGHSGESKDKVFHVKRVEDLPSDFDFASKMDEMKFNASIAAQELNARELYAKYQQQEQTNQYQEYLNKEAVEVQQDIDALQKEGILPKFQYKSDDPKFDSDPAVKEANEVYDLFKKTNDTYIKAGKTYRISYRDAADKYYAYNARNKKPAATPTPVQKERTEAASKVGASQGADPGKQRVKMPPGSTQRDVLKLYNAGRI